ncbi:unnamed protein product [Durusdinium trenchii]|uniref:Ubiquitin-like domain-containing protein n=1 Tax=Durusdinium trenchii TaxID=1381693 RepID=A0ABP0LBY6_9DINO
MVRVISLSGEKVLDFQLSEFETSASLLKEVAMILELRSCTLIRPSGEELGTNVNLLESLCEDDELTVIGHSEDPLLEMMGFQRDGEVVAALAHVSRQELRRMALICGEKLLRKACDLATPRPGRGEEDWWVEWPFHHLPPPSGEGGASASSPFAGGRCEVTPELPVIPPKTRLLVSGQVSELRTSLEIGELCRRMTFEEEKKLLRSDEAKRLEAKEVWRIVTLKRYSEEEICLELGHEFGQSLYHEIGLDTDDNGLIDSFETAAWSVPMEDAWVGIDLQYMPETAARVRSRGFLLEGDLVVGIRWEGNVDDLDLSVVGPGSEYLDFNLTEGDFYRVSDFGLYAVPCNPGDGCTTPVRSSLFVIALAGDYDIMVYRRGEKPWSQLSISAHVRLCGRDIEYQLTLADNEQNDTIASGLRVPFSKCHRKPQSAVQNLRVWQSTVHGGGASVDRMWYLADDNPHSCMETGGEGSPTPDAKPWWRVSLENTQIVQGLWLAGQSGPGVATHADVFTSSSTQKDVSAVVDVDSYNGQIFYVYNATTQYCYRVTIGQQIEEDQQSSVHACDALGFPSNTASNYFLIGSYTSTAQNEQSFENGVTCSKASGHRHGVLNTVIRSDNGALEVTVREIRPCFYEATLHVPLSTILRQGTLCAEDVPIGVLEDPFQVPATRACMQESRGSTVWVVAKYGRLRLCEVELFTEPLPTVTQVSFDYGASGNESVGAVCGANNISIEFSDDNVTWMKAWDAWADASVYQHVQFARWSWWQRLFALPFHTNFSQAESRNVTIPSLRENSSYDVLCWATDAIGNDIMQSMVVLPLPWADTRENNETLRCTGWVREIMPCVVQALLVDVQTTTEGFFTGNTERVSFRMELRDGSCNFRDLSWLTYGGTCLYPRCDEQAWSNEYPVHLSFGMLQPGEDYTLVCFVTDPWGNEAQQEFTLSIPERTTPAPPSTQSTSQRETLRPAPVTQPPTQPRTTQSVEYYTRAPTVRTTAAASTSMQPPAFTTTDRTWEPRTTEEPTTTTTTTIEPLATLPPWLENYVPAGPLRTEMTLSTSSREDAEELVLPAAMNALKSALRSSLELGPLDKLTIEGTEIYLEGGSGRRLAERWLVRVRFTVEAYNAVQNKALLQRVGQLGLGESSVSSNFQEQLSVELAQRGVPLPVDFVGSIPLQDGEQWSPVPSPLLRCKEIERMKS